MSKSYTIMGATGGSLELVVEPLSDKFVNISLQTSTLNTVDSQKQYVKLPIKRFRHFLQELVTELALIEKGK